MNPIPWLSFPPSKRRSSRFPQHLSLISIHPTIPRQTFVLSLPSYGDVSANSLPCSFLRSHCCGGCRSKSSNFVSRSSNFVSKLTFGKPSISERSSVKPI